MKEENLADNIYFVLEVIIDDIDEASIETLKMALILSQYSWNNAVQKNYSKKDSYKKEFEKLLCSNPNFWKQVIRNDEPSLIEILTKRKLFFYPNDKRLVKSCFINAMGTLSAEEDNEKRTLHIQSYF
jgi:hypothetical protein